MSALYSVWDIVCFPSLLDKMKTNSIVRRPYYPQSQHLRCQRLRSEIRWLVALLGYYLVVHFPRIHGNWDYRWHSCVPSIIQPAAGRLEAFHPNAVI